MTDAVFEARCERELPASSIEVTYDPVRYSLDVGQSAEALTQKFPPMHPGYTLGTTYTTLSKRVSVDSSQIEQPLSGKTCVRPHVKVHLAFNPMAVYVASDFPVNSCKYNEVLAHEMRHVDTYAKFLSDIVPQVTQQFDSEIGTNVAYFTSAEAANKEIQVRIDQTLMPYLDNRMQEIEALQHQIDNVEEYGRLARTCNGQLIK